MQTQNKTPYLNNLINQVKADYKRKMDMEANFQRSMVEEYDALCNRIINNTIELLKYGIEYTDDSKTIVIQLDENLIIDISKSDIEKRVGRDVFKQLFSLGEKDIDTTSQNTSENVSQNYAQNGCNGYIDPNAQYYQGQQNMNDFGNTQLMNPMMMIPMLMNMMNAMMGNFQNISKYDSYKEPSHIEDNNEMIANMQKRIYSLEKERDEIISESKKKKEDFEKDCARMRNKIQELEHNNQTSEVQKQNLEKTNEQIKKDKVNCETELRNIKFELSSAKNTVEQYKRGKEADKEKILKLEADLRKSQAEIQTMTENTKAEVERAKAKIEHVKEENHKVVENIKQESHRAIEKAKRDMKDEMDKQINAMKETSDKNTEAKQYAENKVKKAEEKISFLEKQLSNEKEKIKKCSDARASDQEYIQTIKNEKIDLTNQINSLKAKNNNIVRDYENKISNIKRDFEQRMIKSKNNYEKSLDDMQVEINKQADDYDAVITELQEQMSALQSLAYTDIKTELNNSNAFNRDFAAMDPTTVQLVKVSLCGMRNINLESGKQYGDSVILQTVNALTDVFDKETVYRITGTDEFMILTSDKDYTFLVENMESVKNTLESENITIAYGIAIGDEGKQHQNLISGVEEEMMSMKFQLYNGILENEEYDGSYEYEDQEYDDTEVADNGFITEEYVEDTEADYDEDVYSEYQENYADDTGYAEDTTYEEEYEQDYQNDYSGYSNEGYFEYEENDDEETDESNTDETDDLFDALAEYSNDL